MGGDIWMAIELDFRLNGMQQLISIDAMDDIHMVPCLSQCVR
jgi:hypothetical protein